MVYFQYSDFINWYVEIKLMKQMTFSKEISTQQVDQPSISVNLHIVKNTSCNFILAGALLTLKANSSAVIL